MDSFVIKVGDVVICEVDDKRVAWNVFSGITYSCYGSEKSIYLGEELVCSRSIRFVSNSTELAKIRLEEEELPVEELKRIKEMAENEIKIETQWANLRNEEIDMKSVDHALDVLSDVSRRMVANGNHAQDPNEPKA